MKQKLSNLLCVKSIITLGIVGAYIYLSVTAKISPEAFAGVAASILTYYFHREKPNKKQIDESEEN